MKISFQSITSLKEVGAKPDLEFLTALTNLTHLELGDCTSWTKQVRTRKDFHLLLFFHHGQNRIDHQKTVSFSTG